MQILTGHFGVFVFSQASAPFGVNFRALFEGFVSILSLGVGPVLLGDLRAILTQPTRPVGCLARKQSSSELPAGTQGSSRRRQQQQLVNMSWTAATT